MERLIAGKLVVQFQSELVAVGNLVRGSAEDSSSRVCLRHVERHQACRYRIKTCGWHDAAGKNLVPLSSGCGSNASCGADGSCASGTRVENAGHGNAVERCRGIEGRGAEVAGALSGAGDEHRVRRNSLRETPSFIGNKKERSIFLQRTTQGCAKLVLAIIRLLEIKVAFGV